MDNWNKIQVINANLLKNDLVDALVRKKKPSASLSDYEPFTNLFYT